MVTNQKLYDVILDKTKLSPDDKADKNILFTAVSETMKEHKDLVGFQETQNFNNFLHASLLFTLGQYNSQVNMFTQFCEDQDLKFEPMSLKDLTDAVRGDMNCLIVFLERGNTGYFKPLTVKDAILIAIDGFDEFNRNA